MPYGHIKQYLDLVEEAQRKRIKITKLQERQIAKMYSDIAHDLGKDLAKQNSATLSYRWVKDYAKSLKGESKAIFKAIQDTVTSNILNTTNAVTGAQNEFWGGINPNLSERFRNVFSSIPQQSVDELMHGGIYKDFTGLSERIWNYKGKFNKDIGYVINRGIIAQKSAFDLAKDLEMYLDPRAKKDFEWSKVYPRCNRTVDYNAQRLARTSVTHAYQLSFQRSTVDNPFIEKYKWLSSNSRRVCELCRQRNGRNFDKDLVPLDHPNGMCVIVPVIGKSYDQIADELADWVNGGDNTKLDKWLNSGRKNDTTRTKQITHKTKEGFPGNLEMNQLVTSVGILNTDILEKEFGKLSTDKLIVTNERIKHIKDHHPDDYSLFVQYGEAAIVNPDFIIKDIKHDGTVFMIKKLEETNLNVIVRLLLDTDNPDYKNSIMTFYRIRERNLRKLIEKHELLYSKE